MHVVVETSKATGRVTYTYNITENCHIRFSQIDVVINSFIYFFWKKRPRLLKIIFTRILYFTSNITYSIIEEEINLSNPFAQQQN